MKKCTICRIEKPRVEFSRNSTSRDGHHSRCKECDAKRMKERRNSGDPCVYCGRFADTNDHVPAKCYAVQIGTRAIVKACSECNSLLGAQPLHTVEERRKWLKAKYEKRYASILSTPDWTEEEIKTLGRHTADMIRMSLATRDRLRRMLSGM